MSGSDEMGTATMTICSLLIDFSGSLEGFENIVYNISRTIYNKLIQYCTPPVILYVFPGDRNIYKAVSPYELEMYLKNGVAEGPSPLAEAILRLIDDMKRSYSKMHIFVLTDGYQYAERYMVPLEELENRGKELRREIGIVINISIFLLWRSASINDIDHLGSRREFGRKLSAILFESGKNRDLLIAMLTSGIEGRVCEGNITVSVWRLLPAKNTLDRIDKILKKSIM